MTDTTERADMKLAYAVRNAALNTLRECDVSEELLAAVGVATYASILAPQPMGEDAVERVARAIEEAIAPMHLLRGYIYGAAGAALSAMPQPTSTIEAGDALREARELLCQRCGQEYRVWCAASPLWNAVVRGGSIDGREEYAFLCPNCFMALAEDRNIASLFQVRAARTIKLETVTPSGREWNDAEFAFTPALAKLDTAEKGDGE